MFERLANAASGPSAQSGNNPQHSMLRRCLRVLCFVGLFFGLYVTFHIVTFRYKTMSTVLREYSADTFQLEVKSCDVEILKGAKREVKITGMLRNVKETKTTIHNTPVIRFLRAENGATCNSQPGMHCERICKVTIYVPDGAAPKVLWIYQAGSDTTNHVIMKATNVNLKGLTIRGPGGNWWASAGPTMEVDINDGSIAEKLLVVLGKGHFNIRGTSMPPVVDVRNRNSVTLLDIPETKAMTLQWRQPANYMCAIGAENQLALPDPKGNFANCDSNMYQSLWMAAFDSSKDFFLDKDEYGAGMDKVPICCGGMCPHASYCAGLLYNMFPNGAGAGAASGSLASRGEIQSGSAAWAQLKELGFSGHVPRCFRDVRLSETLNVTRSVDGWPAPVAGTPVTVTTLASLYVPCLRHSDCATLHCKVDVTSNTGFRCSGNPAVTYTFEYEWSSCDKPCGGGQKFRTHTCIGNDGRKYPAALCTDNGSPSGGATLVNACNAQACVSPGAAPKIWLELDMDLRADYLNVQVQVTVPTGSTGVRLHLGTANAVLDTVASEEAADCDSATVAVCAGAVGCTGCTLSVETKVPEYVDRIYAVGFNADGAGPAVHSSFVDRIGTATAGSWKLGSDSAHVQVRFRATDAKKQFPYEPKDKLTGVRMNHDDAKLLMTTVGKTMGDAESTAHGLVVIDTVPALGAPKTRWLYVTRPVYLAMDPAHLAFFTAGVLTPTISSYRVRWTNMNCDGSELLDDGPNEQWDFDAEGVSEEVTKYRMDRMTELYVQMKRSLRSDGWASAMKLRGQLILVGPNHKLKPMTRQLYFFQEMADGNITMRKLEAGALDVLMDTAVVLSLVAGAFLGLLAVSVLFILAKKELNTWQKEQKMKRTALANRLGDKAPKAEEPAAYAIGVNPFAQPLVLIGVFIVMPFRRKFVSSLRRFMLKHVDVDPPPVEFPGSLSSPQAAIAPASNKVAPAPDIETGGGPRDAAKVAPEPEGGVTAGVGEVAGDVKDAAADAAEAAKDAASDVLGAASGAVLGGITNIPILGSLVPYAGPAGAKKPRKQFVYMKEFRRRYEEFCIKQGLNPVTSRTEISQKLVSWYDLRTTQETICRIRGVKWRHPTLPAGHAPMDLKLEGTTPGSATPSDGVRPPLPPGGAEEESSLSVFFKQHVEVTRDFRNSYIDMATRARPNGKVIEGFRPRYMSFCQAHNLDMVPLVELDPTLDEGDLVALCDEANVPFQEVTVQRITNVCFNSQPSVLVDSQAILVDLIEVLCHIFFLCGPPFILVVYTLVAQQIYARTLATGDSLQWVDVVGSWAPYVAFGVTNHQVMPLMRWVGATQLAYTVLVVIRVMLHYIGVNCAGKRMYDAFFGVVLLGELCGFFWWVGTVASWCVLAAILEPTKFLSYGAAVLVVAVVIITVWKEMSTVAATMKSKVSGVIEEKMQGMLHSIKLKVEAEQHALVVESLHLRQRTSGAKAKKMARKVDDATAGFDEYHNATTHKHKQKPVTLTDIFNLLDKDQDGELSLEEFHKLFATADGTLTTEQIEQLFAYCDTDGSHSIQAAELEEGWSFVTGRIVEKEMANMGISMADIVVMVVLVVFALLTLFAFIFLAMQGWYAETSFNAMVQTALISGSGKLVTAVRARAPGEDKDVNAMMSQVKDAADGDGDGDGGGE